MRATAELPILASSTSLIDNAKIRHFLLVIVAIRISCPTKAQ